MANVRSPIGSDNPQHFGAVSTNVTEKGIFWYSEILARDSDNSNASLALGCLCVVADSDGFGNPASYRIINMFPVTWEAFPPPAGVASANTSGPTYTMNLVQRQLFVDASSNPVTVTLPSAASAQNFTLDVCRDDATLNAVLIIPAAPIETINDATALALPGQFASATLYCNGLVWRTV